METNYPTQVDDNPAVTQLLKDLRRIRRRRGPILAAAVTMSFAWLLGGFLGCIYQGQSWHLPLIFSGIVVVLGAFGLNRLGEKRRLVLLYRLVHHHDKRMIPELLESADDMASVLQFRIRQSLFELLSTLGPTDFAIFEKSTVRSLVKVRLGSRDYQLVCALLEAIERTGATWALHEVEWLTGLSGEFEHKRFVRETARKCAAHLRALMEKQPTDRLLRPAEAGECADLLRSAQTSQDAASDRLLRPEAPNGPD